MMQKFLILETGTWKWKTIQNMNILLRKFSKLNSAQVLVPNLRETVLAYFGGEFEVVEASDLAEHSEPIGAGGSGEGTILRKRRREGSFE